MLGSNASLEEYGYVCAYLQPTACTDPRVSYSPSSSLTSAFTAGASLMISSKDGSAVDVGGPGGGRCSGAAWHCDIDGSTTRDGDGGAATGAQRRARLDGSPAAEYAVSVGGSGEGRCTGAACWHCEIEGSTTRDGDECVSALNGSPAAEYVEVGDSAAMGARKVGGRAGATLASPGEPTALAAAASALAASAAASAAAAAAAASWALASAAAAAAVASLSSLRSDSSIVSPRLRRAAGATLAAGSGRRWGADCSEGFDRSDSGVESGATLAVEPDRSEVDGPLDADVGVRGAGGRGLWSRRLRRRE